MAPLDTGALSPITSGNLLFCAILFACRNLQNQDLAKPGFSPECKIPTLWPSVPPLPTPLELTVK